MNFLKPILLTFLFSSLLSCENDVEINAEFTEVTNVVGLIDIRADTQFIKITRTFLDDEQNAIALAGQADRIYYDSLDVKLVKTSTNEEIILNKIQLPKEPGLFTQDRNEVYFTSEKVSSRVEYKLVINEPGSDVTTSATASATSGAALTRPRIAVGGKINLVNFQGGVENPRFEFQTSSNIGEFDVTMRFNYMEVTNVVDSTLKFFEVPFSTFRNVSLEEGKQFVYILDGQRFFTAFESFVSVVEDNKSKIYRFLPEKNVSIIIKSADGEYALYRDVNGPIDGLSQTRPEFTNVTNGIGLFASRTETVNNLDLNGFAINYILANYGKTSGGDVGNTAKFRGFLP